MLLKREVPGSTSGISLIFIAYGITVKAMVENLTREQQEEFCKEVQRRVEGKV